MKSQSPFLRATASLGLLGLLGLSLLARPALAYEEDTHFAITFVQCRAAGMTDAEALTVATYDQGRGGRFEQMSAANLSRYS